MKLSLLAALAGAAVLSLSVPAMAAPFTTTDGVLSIELPSESWSEIQDPLKWVALSDGANLITIEHFSNGETLPGIAVADSVYVNTVTASYSTLNEVFVATAYIKDPAQMNPINASLLSIKVLKNDTKTAVNTNQPTANQYTIVPIDKTMYVNVQDSLNIRSGFAIDTPAIGELGRGDTVKVTGIVQFNGQDFGWMQIAYNNGQGYVSTNYLSDTPPAALSSSAGQSTASSSSQGTASTGTSSSGTSSSGTSSTTSYDNYSSGSTDNSYLNSQDSFLVYSNGSGRPVNLIGSNGVYYDSEGNQYSTDANGNIVDSQGASYSYSENASSPTTTVIGAVSEGSGRPVTIMQNEDGSYTDSEGNSYDWYDDTTMVDSDGASYTIDDYNSYAEY